MSHYSISPGWPTGLSLDSNETGANPGTTTAASSTTNYTITASNVAGSSTTVIKSIAVLTAPSGLTYSSPLSSSNTYLRKNTTISSASPSFATGTGTHFMVDSLPAGLSINSSTGVISGTPSAASSTANYTVTATDSAGSSTTVSKSIAVLTAPSGLAYSAPLASDTTHFRLNDLLSSASPSFATGTGTHFTVSPALPMGLSLDSITGVISGTPTAASSKTAYTITAKDSANSSTTVTKYIAVLTPPAGLNYAGVPGIIGTNQAFSKSPSFSAGTGVNNYTLSPTLPTGLSLNAATGVISGTPIDSSPSTAYTVTAHNVLDSTSTIVTFRVIVTPANLTYSANPVQYPKNVVLTDGATFAPDTPSVTGVIAHYSASPALPIGLDLDSVTGFISGMATTQTASANYLITASNAVGFTTTHVNITIISGPPEGLHYSSQIAIYGINVPITANNPTVDSGVAAHYVASALPAGLHIDSVSGVITGTPTALSSATDYVITASNAAGPTKDTVNFRVVPAPTELSYAFGAALYTAGIPIAANNPTVTGLVQHYSVSPPLPAGIHLDSVTGVISGTSTGYAAANNYTVSATNVAGSATFVIAIAVDGAPVGFTYKANTPDFAVNAPIAPDSPMVVGTVTHYSVDSLPAGLHIDSVSGVISGTPTLTMSARRAVVTAANDLGSIDDTLFITVLAAPTALTYTTDPVVYWVGVPIANNNPIPVGTIRHYAAGPALPDSLHLDSVTGVISGKPTVAAATRKYGITGSNVKGSITDSITLTVNPAPGNLAYSQHRVIAWSHVNIDTIIPSITGVVTNYSVDSLPDSLHIDPATGRIYGHIGLVPSRYNLRSIVTASNPAGSTRDTIRFEVHAAPSNLAYPTLHDSASLGLNIAIASKSPTVTDSVTHYSVSPALPDSMKIDSITGVLSGDPKTASGFTSYTVTGGNPSGSTTKTLVFRVLAAPTGLAYAHNPVVYGRNVLIGQDSASVTGIVHRYTVDSLPPGLVIDSLTGVISGTPAAASAAANYVVTAGNAGGQDAETVRITVLAAPTGLTYTRNTATYGLEIPIADNHPSVTGTITHYAVNSLPAGLVIEPVTGVISGTPTTATAAANYVVSADNIGGSSTDTLRIAVLNPITSLSHVRKTLVLGSNLLMLPDTAVVTATAPYTPVTFSANTALPAGLSLDSLTGLITGTPTAAQEPANYVMTVSNGPFNAKDTISIRVFSPLTSLAYKHLFLGLGLNVAMTPDSAVVTPVDTPVTYSINPSLPAGLSLDPLTGIISGTPTAAQVATGYRVTVTNGPYSATDSLTIRVLHPITSLSHVRKTLVLGSNLLMLPDTAVVTATSPYTPVTFSANTALPAGLSLDSLTGIISGTPTAAQEPANYVVTVSNGPFNAKDTISIRVFSPLTSLAYKHLFLGLGLNVAMTPDTAEVSPVDTPVTYSINPSLPAGLSLDPLTGIISGTPTAAQVATGYRVTVTNGPYSATDSLTIRVLHPITSLSHVRKTLVLGSNLLMLPDTAVVTATSPYTPVTFSANTALPAGLSQDSLTGIISGTPTAAQAPANYVVTVSNGMFNAKDTISIRVFSPIASLTHKHLFLGLGLEVTMTPDTAEVSPVDTPVTYSINPSLPAGLSLDPLTGIISGTPTAAQVATGYRVTVTNGPYSATDSLTIRVLHPITSLSHVRKTLVLGRDLLMLPDTAVVTATAPYTPVTFSANTALPAGLSLDSLTGLITGIPTSAQAPANYVVTVSNGTFNAKDTISINVLNPPTGLTYSMNTAVFGRNIAIANDSPTVTAAAPYLPIAYSISSLPAGLALDAGTGVISGTPTTASGIGNYTVTVSNVAGSIRDTLHFTVLAPPSGLTYSKNSVVFLLNGQPIVPDSPSVSGTVQHYSISPALPSGLGIDSVTGIISGTATSSSSTVSYTVTATNIAGSATRILSISVLPPPSNLSYPRLANRVDFAVGVPIIPDTPAVTGTVTLYSVAPALPTGLSLNAFTGIISGTPTVARVTTNYTITAQNAAGSTTTVDTIRTLVAPTALSYSMNPATYGIHTAITANTPTVTGTVTHYSISPALPDSLKIDSITGVISGKPVAAQDTVSYTVTGSNVAGTTTAIVKIRVVNAPTALSYAGTPFTYWVGTAIVPDTGSLTATFPFVPVTYTRDSLPAGLILNSSTGIISGTPSAVSAAANYHITATNAAGNTVSTVNFTVNGAPSNLSYARNTDTVWVGVPITANNPAITGVVTHYAVSSLPAGLSIDSNTGVISGTPAAASAATNYTVTASNPATPGSTTKQVNIVVYPAPNSLAYRNNPVVFGVNVAMTPDTASVTNTIVKHYSATLPAGLVIDSITGRITGTPTQVHADSGYVVTVTNPAGSDTETVRITVLAVPANLAYAPNPKIFYQGVLDSITASVTGTIAGFTSAALPAGLTLNSTTGLIKGTPTSASSAANYLVTASNIAGSDTENVNITVRPAPTNLSYTRISDVYVVGTPIAANNPTVTGTVTHYSISPALPNGVSIDPITGVISGTPTAGVSAHNDTVTACNPAGCTTKVLAITSIAPPANLVYTRESLILGLNLPLAPADSPSVTNPVTQYSVSPALPAGLSLNVSTGVISGTPTVTQPATNHVIMATNIAGSDTETVAITVLAAPTALSFVHPSVVYVVGTPITPDTSHVTGVVRHYSVSPALPAGLALDSLGGIMSGTPTSGSPATNYVLTASNVGGSTTAPLTITVLAPPTNLAYVRRHPVYGINLAIMPDSATVTGSMLQYSVDPTLPNGLSLNINNGVISGTPTVSIPDSPFVVTATNLAGSTSDTVHITILPVPSGLAYSSNPAVYGKNVVITNNTPSVSGAVTHYSVSPALPDSLKLDSISGIISGKPKNAMTATNFLVTGRNLAGQDTETVTITVLAPPADLHYSQNPAVYGDNVAIAANNPTVTGTVTNYSVLPPLPSGLSLDAVTGIISGTHAGASSAANYVVTAANLAGSDTEAVNIKVVSAPTGLAYTPNKFTFGRNLAITPTTAPAVTGSNLKFSATLPAGLSIDSLTGVISGTPTTASNQAAYTITATNVGGSTTTTDTITVLNGPTSLSYSPSAFVFGRNVTITPTAAPSVNDSLVTFSASLPAGLSIASSTGIISGTPTAVSAAANYTITATNAGGSTTAQVNLTVLAAPTGLHYSQNPAVYGSSVAITPNNPSATGTITHFAVSPPLPSGLNLDSNTGVISGTPAGVSGVANYLVTGSNVAGQDTETVTISAVAAPSGLSYTLNSVVYKVGDTLGVNTPTDNPSTTGGGVVTHYGINPALPAGLILNTTTGVISGIPTADTPVNNYTDSACNPGGCTTRVLTITVFAKPANLAYHPNPAVYGVNLAITPNTPTVTNTVTQYAVAPSLPAGLSLNINTGVISGTPTSPTAATNYLVTATNVAGSDTETVNIYVPGAPSALSYPSPVTDTVGISASHSPTVMGTVTHYAVSHALPAGLLIDSVTGVISGKPVTPAAAGIDTVTASNVTGSTTFAITIAVQDTSPRIAYKRALITAVKNLAITPDTIVSTGGAVNVSGGYALSAGSTLPAGLNLDNTTGLIHGTPSAVTASVNDTIIATGPGGTGHTVVNITVADTAPMFTYKLLTIAAVKHVIITPDTVVETGTGGITGYAMALSTPLPSGLSLNSSTGLISGTPSSVTAAANDTVIATGPGGTGRVVVNITVADTSPAFVYKRLAISSIRHVAITPDTVTVTGTGAISSYAVSSSTPLPAGLLLDGSTGLISGTPSAVTAAANDTIIATGPGGTGHVVVNITVADTAPRISYVTPLVDTIGKTASHAVTSTAGAVTHYSISPALPDSMKIDSVTGLIHGIPTSVSDPSNYTVTATGPGGTSTANLNLAIVVAKPAIAYSPATVIDTIGKLGSHAAVSTGGPIVNCLVSTGTMPSGYSIDNTCLVSGTPLAAFGATTVYITASNSSGSSTAASLTLSAVVAKPVIAYSPSAPVDTVGKAAVHAVTSTSGPITSCAVTSGSLPSTYSIDSACKVTSTGPTAPIASTPLIITATNSSGTGTASLTLSTVAAAPTVSYLPSTVVDTVGKAASHTATTTSTVSSCRISPALPAGLSISNATCNITGTPTAAFPATAYTITDSNSTGTGSTVVNIAVQDTNPRIAYSPSSVTDTTTKAATHTPTSTGGPITSCVASHPLPGNLTLSSSCVISGTPNAASAANLDTITATGPGGTGTATITITVVGPPLIAYSPSSVTDTTTKAATHTPTSTGGSITSCVASHPLPGNLTLSSSCVISGTPNAASAANLDTITATGPGGTGTATITITVVGPPIIAYSPSSVTDTTTKAATHTPTSTGGSITSCAASHPLPGNLTLSSSCVISGTPNAASAANLDTITATGPGGTGTATITITVLGPPLIAYSPSSVTDTTTKAATHTVVSTGGPITSCVARHPLPANLTLSSSCVISGTPNAASAANLDTITATGPGGTGTATITITVLGPPLIAYSPSSVTDTTTKAATHTPTSTGGSITSCVASHPLPANLTLSSSCVISGTPNAASAANLDTITATGPGGTGTATITITVVGPPLIAYSPSSVTDTTTKAATHTPTSTGGSITSCAASHPLPGNLTLSSSCVISGTPNAASAANLDTITATGPGGTGTATITITVLGPPLIAYSPSSVTDTTTKAATHTPTSTGGPITSCVARHPLPGNLTLSSSCVISGTPNAASAANLDTITATGPGGTGTATITITVVGPPLIAYSPSSVTDTTTKAATHTPTSTGGSITSCVASHPLPGNLTLSSSCVISGTPNAASAANLDTITATGPGGTGTATITITVVGPPIIAYSPSSVTDTTTKAATHTPTSTGGSITSCVASHPLPANLTLSSSCVISGTPNAASAANLDTITATGPGGTGTATITITVLGPPLIAYSPSSVTDTTTKAATHTPTSTGGPITSCVARHPLPGNLTLSSSCVISGTPNAASAANLDTITATGPGGTGTATITITVVGPPLIAYSPSSVTDTTTKAATHTPTSTGGSITSCVASHPLPGNLTLSSSCVISGTPNAASAANLDTITATGPGGTGTATITITVVGPPLIIYVRGSITAVKNVAITPDTVLSTGGPVTRYAISPALPTGLSLDTVTGRLTGAPTGASDPINYTVTATGPGGTGTALVNISVADQTPSISYPRTTIAVLLGVAIIPDTVISTGGPVTRYTISPALPLGLVLDSVKGILSGAPTVASDTANYTVSATGPGGTGQFVIRIAAINHAPSISYRNAVVIYARNQVAAPDSIVSTDGPVTRYSVLPALPTGLGLDTLKGVISGTPTAATASTNYIVTATGPGGSDTALVNIRVVTAPGNLSYPDDPVTYVVGVASSSNVPTVSGYVTHYSVSPALSAGMSIDTVTGTISGTPTAQSFATDYTVTASSFAGSTQYTLNITVVGAPSGLSYYDDVPTFQVGVAIAYPEDVPTVRGIVTNYSVSPPLPPGVILDQTTGYVLGTPLSASAGTDYTITASNPGGSTTAIITLTVVGP